MSNFLSQYAAARAGGKATGALAGLQIRRTGIGEMRTIEDEIRTMEEKLAEEDESARKRESRRGRGRLAGAILGGGLAALTGGGSLLVGLGAGLGSAAGQELGARGFGTAAGIGSRKRYLDKIRSGLDANEGMFFKGKRKDVDLKRSKINQFLRDADRQFNDSILAGAVTDAMTGFKLKSGGFKDIFGKKDTTVPGLLDFSKAARTAKDQSLLLGSQALDKFIDPNNYSFRDPSNFIDMISEGRFN